MGNEKDLIIMAMKGKIWLLGRRFHYLVLHRRWEMKLSMGTKKIAQVRFLHDYITLIECYICNYMHESCKCSLQLSLNFYAILHDFLFPLHIQCYSRPNNENLQV